MESMLSTLAFAALIGAQFLAAIVLISKRKAIYSGTEHRQEAEQSPSEQIPSAPAGEEPRKAA
jgi:hypothetical protein